MHPRDIKKQENERGERQTLRECAQHAFDLALGKDRFTKFRRVEDSRDDAESMSWLAIRNPVFKSCKQTKSEAGDSLSLSPSPPQELPDGPKGSVYREYNLAVTSVAISLLPKTSRKHPIKPIQDRNHFSPVI